MSDDQGLPNLPGSADLLPLSLNEAFPGRLVTIEGADGSGRSTHIRLLRDWLEWKGYAVAEVGLKRSTLLGEDLTDLAKSNELQNRTRLLLYATDLYDQIEQVVVPSLRAGFVVLADRAALTLTARALVRGVDKPYLDALFQYVPTSDVSLLLEVPSSVAFSRLFVQHHRLMFHEFGGDLKASGTVFERFVAYQTRLCEALDAHADAHGFVRVDAARSVQEVNDELRRAVAAAIGIEDIHYRPSDELLPLWSQR